MRPVEPLPNFAFVFPGQGSQFIGMLGDLATEVEAVERRFATASRVIGIDLWDLVSNGPEKRLNLTENTQPAMLAAGVATWDAWLELGGAHPRRMAGHSFGEYTALVCSGALEFEEAVSLAADRGRFIQEAVPDGEGAMAAVLGLEQMVLEELCEEASNLGGTCACANLNAPGQTVIAGNRTAVDFVCEAAKERGAKRVIRLAVSAPIHCDLMRPAAVRLAERLQSIGLKSPQIEVIHNFDARPHSHPDAIKEALIAQLYSPVRWIESIEYLANSGVNQINECGPGKVLTALIKRIDRSIDCSELGDARSIQERIATCKGGR